MNRNFFFAFTCFVFFGSLAQPDTSDQMKAYKNKLRDEYNMQKARDSVVVAMENKIQTKEIALLSEALHAKRKQHMILLGVVVLLLAGNVYFYLRWKRSSK